MHTILFTHPDCLDHETGPDHPERPDRLRAVLQALEDEAFAFLDRRDAPLAERADLERVHDPRYVQAVLDAVPARGLAYLDHDTVLGARSGDAALRAAGAVVAAVDAVLGEGPSTAFCAVRPPGHHAEADRAMGFCLFNNVAVGALRACAVHGLERVAVVDFDVHHGNGTQDIFAADERLFYASSHQYPCYPGTGSERESGIGNIVNVELPPGAGSPEFQRAYTTRILPALRAFKPQLLFISAGFDGDARDPLAHLRLKTGDFAWVTRELMAVARETCDGRVVSVLEGGYDLAALGQDSAAHMAALMAG
jgi:acetoin utilization deacetylase AcuC-like enzyme